MRITALMTVRNEANYLDRSLRHLISEGIAVRVVDNESTDSSLEIARAYLGQGVTHIYTKPYSGTFDLIAQLQFQENIANQADSDWFIHCDADEILESPWPGISLKEAIAKVDSEGFNAISFDEFVFIPTNSTVAFENTDYVEQMKYYYYYAPWPQHLIRAWRQPNSAVNLSSSGGHSPQFEGRQIYPHSFVLRHYIVLSLAHAKRKYGIERRYSEYEKNVLNWHGWRGRYHDAMFILPDTADLAFYKGAKCWDRSRPTKTNLFVRDSISSNLK